MNFHGIMSILPRDSFTTVGAFSDLESYGNASDFKISGEVSRGFFLRERKYRQKRRSKEEKNEIMMNVYTDYVKK